MVAGPRFQPATYGRRVGAPKATRPDFQKLKNQLGSEWLPEMCRARSIDPAELPVIWEADFMYGRTGNRRDVCPKERRRPCDITAEKLV